ncbi:MAG: hypothetical protein J6386_13515 [Candidatus Synoicihabitans palmerolidicus]|nr:hypothetical protein [Candidatus Synoicihabitans palmerolidicus]
MVGLQPSLYTVAFALCVFSTGILSDRRARAGRSMVFFTSYLSIESLGFALELLVAHPATPFKALWLGLLMATSLLTAPCLWLAVRETITDQRPRLRDLSCNHWFVIATGTLLTIPLMSAAHAGSSWGSLPLDARAWHYDFIHHAMIGCIAIFTIQVPYYLWRSRQLLLDQNPTDPSTPFASHRWFHLPLWIVGTTWLMGMARMVQCASQAPVELNAVFSLADVGMTVGAMFLIIKRASVGERLLSAPHSTAPL